MKLFNDKKYNKIFRYSYLFAMLTLLSVFILFRWDAVRKLGVGFMKVFSPIIWGLVLAFIMNPIMKKVEVFLNRRIFKKKARPKASRALGIIVASVLILAIIAAIILSIIPELISNLPGIYDALTNEVLPAVQNWAKKLLDDNTYLANVLTKELNNIFETVKTLFSGLGPRLMGLLSSFLDFANSVKNFALGFILAIYFLFSKEALQTQIKQLIVALFSEKTYRSIFAITSNTNHAFLSFIYGKVIDSLIIGIICAIGMIIFRMPYVMIASLVIGITNVIPLFGPFIGGALAAVLIVIAEPGKLIWFILFVIALQQLDGNVIGPMVLGDKIGLSSFWVLFSILICGSLFGIVGMIIGVPLFAVIFDIINSIVEVRLKNKDMPTDKEYYSVPGVDIAPPEKEPQNKQ